MSTIHFCSGSLMDAYLLVMWCIRNRDWNVCMPKAFRGFQLDGDILENAISYPFMECLDGF